ncbi:hypothetical protein [Azospirillum sp. B4]|uniref:hypothetical protein n=1 Tax=Azospirillum sp. B4 TaxID=95605 RepID=UPI0011DC7F3A|nr:hypothetical protein [Azospirillum sp. B4]
MAKTSKRFSDNPAWRIPLNDDQLRDLGTLFAVWGQIDLQILQVISWILESDMHTVVALLDNVTSGTLISYLRKISSKIKNDEVKKEVEEFCELMGALIEKRNHLSHGAWGWLISEDFQKVTPACFYEKSKKPIHVGDLKEITKRIMAESHAINALFRRSTGQPQNPQHLSVDFFWGSWSSDNPPTVDWNGVSPLQPGMDHHWKDQNDQK